MPVATTSNSINLLTREGGICASFKPALNDDQYASLWEAVKHDGDTIADLTELLRRLGRSWGCEVIIDQC